MSGLLIAAPASGSGKTTVSLGLARALADAGVRVTLNSDDPPFFHTSMQREYDLLHETFDWDEAVFRKIARTSLDAAFCDADTRARILKRLEPDHA